jgi:hypothetical protein
MSASPRYLALLEEMAALHKAKAAGYSGEKDTWANFREAESWGVTPLAGCLVRMGDKYRRIQNLILNPANEQVGEAITDTLMDLSAYALIAICLTEEESQFAAQVADALPHTKYPPDIECIHSRDDQMSARKRPK